MDKKIAVMQPGPKQLFWSMGIYLLWSLKKKYNFVLFVPYEYKDDSFFKKIIKERFIIKVFYYPKRNIFNLNYQFQLVKIINKILIYNPNIILQNTINYLEDQYLYHISRKKNKNIHVYLFCQSYYKNEEQVDSELTTLRKYYIENLAVKINLPLKFLIANFLIKIKSFIKISKINSLFSYIFFGIFLDFPFDHASGYKNKKCIRKLNSSNTFFISYDRELDAGFSYYGFSNIIHVENPIVKNAYKFFKTYDYEKFDFNQVLILPTYGNIETTRDKEKIIKQSKLISSKWLEAIQIIKNKTDANKIIIKLHPSMKNDLTWENVLKILEKKEKSLRIISSEMLAESLILQSKYI